MCPCLLLTHSKVCWCVQCSRPSLHRATCILFMSLSVKNRVINWSDNSTHSLCYLYTATYITDSTAQYLPGACGWCIATATWGTDQMLYFNIWYDNYKDNKRRPWHHSRTFMCWICKWNCMLQSSNVPSSYSSSWNLSPALKLLTFWIRRIPEYIKMEMGGHMNFSWNISVMGNTVQ